MRRGGATEDIRKSTLHNFTPKKSTTTARRRKPNGTVESKQSFDYPHFPGSYAQWSRFQPPFFLGFRKSSGAFVVPRWHSMWWAFLSFPKRASPWFIVLAGRVQGAVRVFRCYSAGRLLSGRAGCWLWLWLWARVACFCLLWLVGWCCVCVLLVVVLVPGLVLSLGSAHTVFFFRGPGVGSPSSLVSGAL